MQKANELYDVYYIVYFQFSQKLEEARSLLQKCKENAVYGVVIFQVHYCHLIKLCSAVNLPIIIYQMNFLDKYGKETKRKSNCETYFCQISATDIRHRHCVQTKQNFRPPHLALFLSNLNYLYDSNEEHYRYGYQVYPTFAKSRTPSQQDLDLIRFVGLSSVSIARLKKSDFLSTS